MATEDYEVHHMLASFSRRITSICTVIIATAVVNILTINFEEVFPMHEQGDRRLGGGAWEEGLLLNQLTTALTVQVRKQWKAVERRLI